MPVAAFRLTGSVSGFHDSALVSVMVHVTPDAPRAVHRTAARLPSMARERLCVRARRTALDGAHERATRQSCDQLPVQFADWVCGAQALLRADRPGRAATQSGARRPGRAHSGRASGIAQVAPSPRRPSRGPGATCHPWRQGWSHGWSHGWSSPCIRRDAAGGAARRLELRSHNHGRVGAAVAGWPRSRETAPLG